MPISWVAVNTRIFVEISVTVTMQIRLPIHVNWSRNSLAMCPFAACGVQKCVSIPLWAGTITNILTLIYIGQKLYMDEKNLHMPPILYALK